jgi:hypothetical protein
MRNDAALLRGVDLSSVVETTNFLKTQIQLRHSAYYDNEEVTTRVADFLVGAEVGEGVGLLEKEVGMHPA